MKKIPVSVIVPIYKVRDYIERCAQSLMNQTLKEAEFIFINDATTDDSMDVLQRVLCKYPDRLIRIINHEHNKGLPAARNTGLLFARGEYIYHCDSDDYLEPDMLENMYNVAISNNLDIVYCDYYLSFNKNEKLIRNKAYYNIDDYVREGLLGGRIKYNVWNKLIRRAIYVENGIVFPEGYAMGEDMTIIRLAINAKTVTFLPRAYYHYNRTNVNSYSIHLSDKNLVDINYNVSLTEKYVMQQGTQYKQDIAYFKINTKLPFIISGDKKMYEIWRSMWPDTNPYIWNNPNHSLRIKLLEMAAVWHCDVVLRIYHSLLNKLIYGCLFR